MKTTITQDNKGNPVVSVEGEQSPETVANAYLNVQKILRPDKQEEKKE